MKFPEYPKTCPLCGVEFIAHNIKAKYCVACRITADRMRGAKYRATEKGKETARRKNARHRAEGKILEWKHRYNMSEKGKLARQRYDASDLRKASDARYAAKRRLIKSAERNEPGARLKLAKLLGEMTYCERMHLTAYPLPCGTRGECQGCPHCPKDAPCNSRNFFVQQMVELGGW